MQPKSMIALLPLLAALPLSAFARPTHDSHSHSHSSSSAASRSSQRKTLNFGPSHPHAFFTSVSEDVRFGKRAMPEGGLRAERLEAMVVADEVKPVDLAREFLTEQLGDGVEYFVREDSYTDPRNQVSHIFVKQLVNGLEVADGDINVNIHEGRVLSWGNSFYNGAAPVAGSSFASQARSANDRQCTALRQLKDEHHAHYSALKSKLDDILSSGGVADVLKGGLKLAGEFVLGITPSAVEAKVREAVAELEGLSKDEIESLLFKMEHQAKTMEDHMAVVCSSARTSPKAGESFAGNHGGMATPEEALAHLMKYIAPERDLLPEEHHTHLRSQPAHSSFAPENAGAAWAEPPRQIVKGLQTSGPNAVEGGEAKARLMYHQVESADGTSTDLALVWRFEVQMQDNWYDASVDAQTLEVVSVVDWASDAPPAQIKAIKEAKAKAAAAPQKPFPKPSPATPGYRVFPWGINDPSVGNHTFVTDPWDKVASPAGWHAFPDSANLWVDTKIKGVSTGNKVNFTVPGVKKAATWTLSSTTVSNNVFAQENFEGQSAWLNNWRPVNESLAFDYEYGEYDGLRPKEYIDASVTQLFYTCNMYHDYLYRLGFDEISGNFQMENWGLGGKGGDAVIAQAQDGSGTDNANMMTPPDGSMPRMRMYVWDTHTPYLDGDFEAGIVIHEYTHGLSTRLTGGPANSQCLSFGEGGGMGEGWGDCFATLIRQIEEHHKNESYPMGAWAANNAGKGIRNYPYIDNMTTNPSTYKFLDKPGYWGVHAIGEVYAEMIFVLSAHLIEKHGFSKTLWPPADHTEANDFYRPNSTIPIHGNTLMAQLLVDSMKLQPCRPTFTDNRDALLSADEILTGGENKCIIWEAFSQRGLGPEAKLKGSFPWGGGIRDEDFAVPMACLTKKD